MQHRSRLTIKLLRARVRRFSRRLRARLCCSGILLGLLALGLGEALLCIVHCELSQVLHELQSHHGTVSIHHLMGHVSAPAAPEAGPSPQGQRVASSQAPSGRQTTCAIPSHSSGPSPLAPPSPIHDLLLTTLVLLSVPLPHTAHLPLSRLRPQSLGKPPPCPPPIPAA